VFDKLSTANKEHTVVSLLPKGAFSARASPETRAYSMIWLDDVHLRTESFMRLLKGR
jgi:hypothetical protein